jgi:hypothetical protein
MRLQLLLAAVSALALSSCYSPGDGQAPPLESLYFPTGLALDTVEVNADGAPRYLYVASSDFDLQYRASSLASFDLDALSSVLPESCTGDPGETRCGAGKVCDAAPSADNGQVPSYFCVAGDAEHAAPPCGAFGDRNAGDQLLSPGRCQAVDPVRPQDGSPKLIRDAVGIGAFATDLILRANPTTDPIDHASRLFLPVRGDATLHWIDLADGRFDCGQDNTSDHSCDSLHRAGDQPSDDNNQLRQPSEPFGIAADGVGRYVGVTNQTTGSVSLFVNDWNKAVGPSLESVLSGLPQAPVAIAAVPEPVLGGAPGFLVAYRNAAQLDLLRVRSDQADTGNVSQNGGANFPRFVLAAAGTAPINANSLGFDSRSIAIDDEQRRNDYEACTAGKDHADCVQAMPEATVTCDYRCLQQAHQSDVYVASRAPSSLLVGAMTANSAYFTGTSELPAFTDSVPLTAGPSRVVLGKVKIPSVEPNAADDGLGRFELERRVFVVCFDSRRIFVYDPKRRVIDAIIDTGRGPYALAVDDVRGLAYVAHFTDSYLGVISLDQRFPQTYATIIASIGAPSPPRSSK